MLVKWLQSGRAATPSMAGAFFLLFSLCLTPSTFADIAHNVVIITSSDSSYQQRTAGRIRENLEEKGARTMIVSADSIASITPNGRTLYVAIGDEAINNLNKFDADAITLRMTSREMPNRRYTSTKADLITAQPDCRHIRLIRSIDPGWSTIGVLSSIESLDIAAALTKCSIRLNINLQVYAITDTTDLLKTLETAVVNNKVLLAINDPLVYNSNTVKNILLTAYRRRKPVIGYSDSFVQAGAVAAVYTSPESAGDKAVSIISKFFANSWQFDKKRYYTDDFSISTNIQVSKSLDINIPDADSIRRSIERMEKKP